MMCVCGGVIPVTIATLFLKAVQYRGLYEFGFWVGMHLHVGDGTCRCERGQYHQVTWGSIQRKGKGPG
jgi:hypothetical protein